MLHYSKKISGGVCFALFMFISLTVFAAEPAQAATLKLPSGVKTIEAEAFYGDTSLDEVVLPEGLTTIGSKAFANSSVKKINLPSSLTTINSTAFDGTSLSQITANWNTKGSKWAIDHSIKLVTPASSMSFSSAATLTSSMDFNTDVTAYINKVFTAHDAVGGGFSFIAPTGGRYTFSVKASNVAESFKLHIYAMRNGTQTKIKEFTYDKSNDIVTFVLPNVVAGETIYWWDGKTSNTGATARSDFQLRIGEYDKIPPEEDVLAVCKTDTRWVIFTPTAATKNIIVTSGSAWTASSNAAWLTMSKSGKTLTLKATKNSSGAERSAVVTVANSSSSIEILVVQSNIEVGPEITTSLFRNTSENNPALIFAHKYNIDVIRTRSTDPYVYISCDKLVNGAWNNTYTRLFEFGRETVALEPERNKPQLEPGCVYRILVWEHSQLEWKYSDEMNKKWDRIPDERCTTFYCYVQETVPVSIVMFDETRAEVKTGQTVSLSVNVEPVNATNPGLTWTTSDSSVATISSEGFVTGKKAGIVTITATAVDGSGKTASCDVTVVKDSLGSPQMWITNITEDSITVAWTLVPGADQYQIIAEDYYEEETYRSTVFDSSTSSGTITGLPSGTGFYIDIKAIRLSDEATSWSEDDEINVSTNESDGTPCPPSVFPSASSTASTISIRWESSPYATNYRVFWGTTKNIDEAIGSEYTNGSCNYTITGLTNNITYYYLVRAYNDYGVYSSYNEWRAKKTQPGSPVNISGFDLQKTTVNLRQYGTYSIRPQLIPSNANEEYTVTYSSSDVYVASVGTYNGIVSAKHNGVATITVQLKGKRSGKTFEKQCTIHVSDNANVPLESFTLNTNQYSLKAGEVFTLAVGNCYPPEATDKTVLWSSSNEQVATVSYGTVTAVSSGTAVITAEARDGYGAKKTCTVHVMPDKAEGVILSYSSIEMIAGGSPVTLVPTVIPSDTTDKTVTWSSTNPSVASVEFGVVRALAKGTATIVAAARSDPSVTATCVVTVKEPATLTVNVKPASVTVKPGDTITMTAAAAGGIGNYSYQWYRASDENADGMPVSGATGSTYSFTSIVEDNGVYCYCVVEDNRHVSAASNRVQITYAKVPATISNLWIADRDSAHSYFEDQSIVAFVAERKLYLKFDAENTNGEVEIRAYIMNSMPAFDSSDERKAVAWMYGQNGADVFTKEALNQYEWGGCIPFNLNNYADKYLKVEIAMRDVNYNLNGEKLGIQFALQIVGVDFELSLGGERVFDHTISLDPNSGKNSEIEIHVLTNANWTASLNSTDFVAISQAVYGQVSSDGRQASYDWADYIKLKIVNEPESGTYYKAELVFTYGNTTDKYIITLSKACQHLMGVYYDDNLDEQYYCVLCQPMTAEQEARANENTRRKMALLASDSAASNLFAVNDGASLYMKKCRELWGNGWFAGVGGAYRLATFDWIEFAKMAIPGSETVNEAHKKSIQNSIQLILQSSGPLKDNDERLSEALGISNTIVSMASDILDFIKTITEYNSDSEILNFWLNCLERAKESGNAANIELCNAQILKVGQRLAENDPEVSGIMAGFNISTTSIAVMIIESTMEIADYLNWNDDQRKLFFTCLDRADKNIMLLEQIRDAYGTYDPYIKDYCNDMIASIRLQCQYPLLAKVTQTTKDISMMIWILEKNTALLVGKTMADTYAQNFFTLVTGSPADAFPLVLAGKAMGFLTEAFMGTSSTIGSVESIALLYGDIEDFVIHCRFIATSSSNSPEVKAFGSLYMAHMKIFGMEWLSKVNNSWFFEGQFENDANKIATSIKNQTGTILNGLDASKPTAP